MRLVKFCISLSIVFLITLQSLNAQKKETLSFLTDDNIRVTADIYMTNDIEAPFIILFHQAGFSRGEYIEIAPKLNDLGFNCMAIDQRSGLKVNSVINETHKFAKKEGKNTKYPDAFPDLEASVNYINKNYSPEKLIVWGSSYSSSLVFVLAAKYKDITGVLSFSPGEYFEFENKKISDWAKEVACPVFITSSKKEGEKCSLIFKRATNNKNVQYIPDFSGFHGSKALWESKSGYKSYWKEVKLFLEKIIEN